MDTPSPDSAVPLADIPLPELLQQVGSSGQGLSQAEADARLARVGPNRVTDVERVPAYLQFLARFNNPLVLLLLAASTISAATGDITSFVIIVCMVVLSVALDFIQQRRAEHAVDALRNAVALDAQVLRDGVEATIPVAHCVPGDVLLLSPGMLVPADGRLLSCKDLMVDQASLTGESFPVEKSADATAADTGEDGQLPPCLAFMGSAVISGTGRLLVLATGKRTRLGHMAGTLAHAAPKTEFEIGLRRFGTMIVRLAACMVVCALAINLLLARPVLESLLFALALAVGLTPELLPMITTITLSRSALRMAKEKVIVKHLPAMHNLGAMDVLCTDKTGTLTQATIRMVAAEDAVGDGGGEGAFLLAYVNAYLQSGLRSPLDTAIIAHASPPLDAWRKYDELPFDFSRRRMSILVGYQGRRLLVAKGAPEAILPCSTGLWRPTGDPLPLDAATRGQLQARFEALGGEGKRVLAVAVRTMPATQETVTLADEGALAFAGFLSFLDPPKDSAADALRQLHDDGVRVKVISGDDERVTAHLCRELGMDTGGLLTGEAIARLDDAALMARLDGCHVFCRVTPDQKSRIIELLQRKGHTVGFMGDGINDATALHMANVGISVDGATDVAKEAARIILLEQDLRVLHAGVREGRRAVANTEKYILMGTSSNFGNTLSMLMATLLVPFLPMLPIQILLNNLLYDISQTVLPFDRVDDEAIRRPIRWDIARIRRTMWAFGPVSSLFDVATFFLMLSLFSGQQALFQTGWFVESLITQMAVIFAIRTRKPLLFSRPHPVVVAMAACIMAVAIALPYLPFGAFFALVALPWVFFPYLAVITLAYLLLVELLKRLLWRSYAQVAP